MFRCVLWNTPLYVAVMDKLTVTPVNSPVRLVDRGVESPCSTKVTLTKIPLTYHNVKIIRTCKVNSCTSDVNVW